MNPLLRSSIRASTILLVFIGAITVGSTLWADVFGSGEHTFEIEFVAIGDPGNPADIVGNPVGAGAVPYSYRIGKYEISEQMIDKANALEGLGITHDGRGSDKPATSVSWFEAAQFVNWLNTSTGHTSAYKFDGNGEFQLWEPEDSGYNPENLFRNSEAKYFLPSADEWYKAAFFDPATGDYNPYPTGGDAVPIPVASGTDPGTAVFHQGLSAGPADVTQAGALSPYGTLGQGGNVYEWEETEFDQVNDSIVDRRGLRGGSWDSLTSSLSRSATASNLPEIGLPNVGFRVASIIPEPSTTTLSLIASMFLLGRTKLSA